MPISDVRDFVLGRGGANWGLPSGGSDWTQGFRSRGGSYGSGGGPASYIPPVAAPVTSYPGASGLAPAGGMNLTNLTNYINQLSRTGQTAANRARIPGAQALEEQSSRNIGAGLRGEIAPDVLRNLRQTAAEGGIATYGAPGSDNANLSYLTRFLGTSMDRQHQAEQELGGAYARNPAARTFDPSTQLLTPYQSSQLGLQRADMENRFNLANAGLALEASRRYSGGGGGGGYNPNFGYGGGGGTSTGTLESPGVVLGNPVSIANTPPGAPNLGPGYTQQNWWDRIGYGTNTGNTGGGTGWNYTSDTTPPNQVYG